MISEERQSHFAHLIVDVIYDDDLVDYEDDGEMAMRAAKKSIIQWAQDEANLDEVVRAKLTTLKRQLIENTPEWDIMYKKYYEEEMNRRGQKE